MGSFSTASAWRGLYHAPARRLAAGTMDVCLSGRLWKFKALLIVLSLAFLRTYPAFEALESDFVKATWRSAQVKFDGPLTDMAKVFPPASHEGKLTFRMTVPLVVHALRLGPREVLVLNAFAGLALLYLVLVLAERAAGGSRLIALLVCLTTACTWPGQAAFHEFRGGYYDAVALGLILLTASARTPALAGLAAFAATWTDERALLALPLVLILNGKQRIPISLAGAVYLALRAILSLFYTTPTAGLGWNVLTQQLWTLPVGFWTSLAGSWIVVMWSLSTLSLRRHWKQSARFAVSLLPVLIAASLVADITRSAAYALPAVFAALAVLEPSPRLKRVILLSTVISLLAPSAYVEGPHIYWLRSLLALS